MQRATEGKLAAAKKRAEAATAFLIAWEAGTQERMPVRPRPELDFTAGRRVAAPPSSAHDPAPEPAEELPDSAGLVDAHAVAKLLGCSATHERRMSKAGRIPPPREFGALNR